MSFRNYTRQYSRRDINALADQLVGAQGAVGTLVRPRRVGVSIRPRNVGAPAVMSPGGSNPVDYHPTQYRVGENTYFPLGVTSVPGGTTSQSINITPDRPFTPMRLFCPSNVQGLLILTAGIRGTNIFASDAGIPIELFSEVSTSPEIDWPTLNESTGITFTVSNPTGGALDFSGMLYGVQVRD